jgi:endonuclease YncB( thermonuclease family)
MRQTQKAIVWRACLSASFLLVTLGHTEVTNEFYGRVVHVYAGDRLDIQCHGRSEHTRLLGIRCPRGLWAEEARQFTRNMAATRGVHVVPRGKDGHGSLFVNVHFIGGRDLGQELVRAGMARWDRQRAPGDTVLAALEAQAQRDHRGLWSAERQKIAMSLPRFGNSQTAQR